MHNLWIVASNIFQIIIHKLRPKVLHIKSVQIKESREKKKYKQKQNKSVHKAWLGLTGFHFKFDPG